jgi:aerobic-type carbon monoxide dehydrogenase small subunit (CoxS/CutS family)
MPDGETLVPSANGEGPGTTSDAPEQPTRPLTRRDFLIRSNAGAVAVGVMTGVSLPAAAEQPAQAPARRTRAATPAPAAVSGAKQRRVTLDIDGKSHEVTVDVRESLWETLNYQLGLSNCNLGCDRAQCGACTVLVDGRPVMGCSLLTARLGRGQKIRTVAGIAKGPGIDGLHPVQRAFWREGGFQCGICTRGFVMSAYALLEANKNPTDAEIREALSGNICRCGEYDGILASVKKAAAEMRGEAVVYTASVPLVEVAKAAGVTTGSQSRQFEFVTALGTIEQFDELALELRQQPGILDVSGSERTIVPTWDPARLDETRVRRILAELGHPVRP